MWVVSLLYLIVLVVAGMRMRHHEAWRRPVVAGALVVPGFLIAGINFFPQHPPGPSEVTLQYAMGMGMGQRLARDFPRGGTFLVVEFRPEDAAAQMRKGLRDGWGSEPAEFKVAYPLGEGADTGEGSDAWTAWSMETLYNLCMEQGPAQAVVCVLGLPPDVSAATLKKLPPLYLLGPLDGRLVPFAGLDRPIRGWLKDKVVKHRDLPENGDPLALFQARFDLLP